MVLISGQLLNGQHLLEFPAADNQTKNQNELNVRVATLWVWVDYKRDTMARSNNYNNNNNHKTNKNNLDKPNKKLHSKNPDKILKKHTDQSRVDGGQLTSDTSASDSNNNNNTNKFNKHTANSNNRKKKKRKRKNMELNSNHIINTVNKNYYNNLNNENNYVNHNLDNSNSNYYNTNNNSNKISSIHKATSTITTTHEQTQSTSQESLQQPQQTRDNKSLTLWVFRLLKPDKQFNSSILVDKVSNFYYHHYFG
jgi:hypothetical protein